MKKLVCWAEVLVVGAMISTAWAEVVGDVNQDHVVGLPEAVNALQTTTGMRSTLAIIPQT